MKILSSGENGLEGIEGINVSIGETFELITEDGKKYTVKLESEKKISWQSVDDGRSGEFERQDDEFYFIVDGEREEKTGAIANGYAMDIDDVISDEEEVIPGLFNISYY